MGRPLGDLLAQRSVGLSGNGKTPPGSPKRAPFPPHHPIPRRLTDANGKESWVTNNTYWKLRLQPGFAHLDSAVLW